MNIHQLKQLPSWEWPRGTSELLLEVLGNRDAAQADRVLATSMASECTIIDDRIGEALMDLLRSDEESEELRGAAAIALGPALEHADTMGFDDAEDILLSPAQYARVRRSLHVLYADAKVPKLVRRRILEASVRAPEDWHSGALRAANASGDPAWRLTALFGARFVHGLDDLVLEALDTDDPALLHEAIHAAGNWRLDAAWPRVLEILVSKTSPQPLVLAAIESAANIRPAEAPSLLRRFADSDDEDVAETARDALVMAAAADELDDLDDWEDVEDDDDDPT